MKRLVLKREMLRVFGVVSTGNVWKFLQLEGKWLTIDAVDYYLADHGIEGVTKMNADNLIATVLALSENDRVQLVEKVLDSLGPETDIWDESALATELRRRSAEIDNDTAELVPWQQLRDEAI